MSRFSNAAVQNHDLYRPPLPYFGPDPEEGLDKIPGSAENSK